MPCNSEHLNPTRYERESHKIMELLVEVGLYEGVVPLYGDTSSIHEHTDMLCCFCQNNDVTKHSLELQIWWRDHQKADKERLEREVQERAEEQTREAALEKLTLHERKLLGL